MTITVSNKGWVVIPAEYRKKYNLKPGATVQVVDYDGVLALVPTLTNPIKEAFGLLAPKVGEKRLTQALIEEHEAENRRVR